MISKAMTEMVIMKMAMMRMVTTKPVMIIGAMMPVVMMRKEILTQQERKL